MIGSKRSKRLQLQVRAGTQLTYVQDLLDEPADTRVHPWTAENVGLFATRGKFLVLVHAAASFRTGQFCLIILKSNRVLGSKLTTHTTTFFQNFVQQFFFANLQFIYLKTCI